MAVRFDGVELDGSKTLGDSGLRGVEVVLWGAASREQVQANFVADVAAQQLPHRHLEVLALDVPEGDIHGRDGSHDGRTPEGSHAVEVLPVVFDAEGILADEVFFEDIDDALHGGGIAPAGGLTDAGQARVRGDADDVAVADEEGFDLFDFHFVRSIYIVKGQGWLLVALGCLFL